MKRFSILVLGTIAAVVTVPFMSTLPVWADIQAAGTAVAQNLQRQPQVNLQLSAEKQVVEMDSQGQANITWEALSGNQITVVPGDAIRYTLKGENTSDRPIRNLVVTQPIPEQTTYVIDSAGVKQIEDAAITYSIDGGTTFVEAPTVEVRLPNGQVETRPAPAEAYTHVRWNFGEAVDPGVAMEATYQVKVR